jgi:CubicO group peptidase (beta-lactamase class C family)
MTNELGFRPERLQLLNERLKQWSQEGKTPAIAVRVLRHGQLAYEAAYGPLTPEAEPNSLRTDSIFPICSMTKPVIGTLACIMQEEGLLDLNAPVKNHFPELNDFDEDPVRWWHFLTHTSGFVADEYDKGEKPAHKPQTQMQYNSLGFNFIKDVIEKISGDSIDTYASEKLFKPLRMNDSHFIFPPEKLNRYVRRESHFEGSEWLNNEILQSTSGGGGLKSTVADMCRFGQMFLNQGILDGSRVLSKASIGCLLRNHNAGLPYTLYNGGTYDASWGLGWSLGSKKDDAGMLRSPSSFEHGGFGCVKLLCDPEFDIVAAFFTVSIKDDYPYAALFNNMVLGALE